MESTKRKRSVFAAAVLTATLGITPAFADDIPSAITPTRGNDASYSWTKTNNGQIPIILDNTTYYTDIKPTAPEGKDYTWNPSTRQYTNLGTSVNGEGYYINNSNSTPVINNTHPSSIIADFIGNYATGGNGGGAISNNGSMTINSIVGDFIGNTHTSTSYGGGAIFNWGNYGQAHINSVTGNFINNRAKSGGAIYNGGGNGGGNSSVTLVDSTFIGNIATSGNGGAIYSNNGTISVTAHDKDVYFINNNSTGTADGEGYGIYINSGTLNLNANNGHKIEIDDNMRLSNATNVTLDDGTLKLGQKDALNSTFKTLNASNVSTLDLQNENGNDVLTVTTLSTDANGLMFNADYDATANSMDKMTVNGGSGKVTLNAVNVLNDNEDFVDGTETTYLDGTARNNVTVRDTSLNSVTDTGFLYTFTPDENTHGLLSVTRKLAYEGDLINAINDDYGEDTPNSYSLSQNFEADRNFGILNNENREQFTIFGNNKNILSNNHSGIKINNGDILNISNVAEFSGTSNYALDNAGTLNITNSNFTNNATADINNTNALNLAGTNSFDKITGNGTTNVTSGATTVANMTQNIVNVDNAELVLTNTNNITTANLNGGELNLTGTNNISTVNLNDGSTITLGKDAVSSFGNNTNLVANGGTLNIANKNIDNLTLSNDITNSNGMSIILDADLQENSTIADVISANITGGAANIELSIINFLHDDAESGEIQIADGSIKNFITLADDIDSGIYATATYDNTTGILSLTDKIAWFKPTNGNASGYKFTKTNTGIIPVTQGDKTFYTEIKKTSYKNGDITYTWNNETKRLTATPSGAATVAELDNKKYIGDTVGQTTGGTSAQGGLGINTEITSVEGDFVNNTTGTSYGGGALFNNTSGNIGSVTGNFIGNTSTTSYTYGNTGSAIDNRGVIGTITADFIGNTSTGKQGVIYNGGTIGTINGDFIGNNDVNGAIYNAGTINDINGNFIANNSSSTGGGIYNNGTITGKINGIFHSNNAVQGPAIYNYNGHTIEEIDGIYTNNTATTSGGALLIAGNVNKISGTFENNTATSGEGGAIYASDYTPGATGSALINIGSIEGIFRNNIAGTNGGAIYSRNKLDSLSGVFENNTAGTSGGAVYSAKHNASDVLNIQDSVFNGNTANGTEANNGGGAIWNNYKLNIDNSSFEGNSANRGGAIFNVGDYQLKGDVKLTDSSFVGNIATSGEGGAIYQKFVSQQQPATTIYAKTKNVEFTNNNTTGTAEGTGTGIHITSGSLTLNADDGRKIVINDDIYSVATNTINAEEETAHTGTVELNGAITNAMSMTVNNGTLKLGQKAVDGTSTTTLGTMTFTTANLPTLDLQNNSCGTLNLNRIVGNANLNLDYDGESGLMDKLNINSAETGSTVVLNNIKILTDTEDDEIENTQFLSGTLDNLNAVTNYTDPDDKYYITSSTDDYTYTFTFTDTKGILTVSREETGINLATAIADAVEGGSSYTMTKNFRFANNAGNLDGENRDFTIYGQNHNIDGNNKTGIVVSGGQSLTVEDVNEFKNFANAVNNKGNLTVNNTTFKNNTNSAIYNDSATNEVGNSYITNSVFDSNSTEEYGGAIYNAGTAVIGGTLSNNIAYKKGGAVYNTGTLTVLDGTNFTANKTTWDGAAGSGPEDVNSNGGAIWNSGSLTIGDNVTFLNNHASNQITSGNGHGSAIYNYGGNINIGNNLSITNNDDYISHDCAIFLQNGTLTIGDNAEISNLSEGIITSGNAKINIGDNLYMHNVSNGIASWGEDIVVGKNATFENIGTTRVFQTVSSNGSFIFGDGLTVKDNLTSTFGNIYNEAGASMTFGSAEFTNNVSDANNAGLFQNWSNLTFNGEATFDSNLANGVAGALRNRGTSSDTVFNDTVQFIDNAATGNGGAVINEGVLTFNSTAEFKNNIAGGISDYIEDENGRWVDEYGNHYSWTITGANTESNAKGGSIHNTGTLSFGDEASFTGNRAGYGGALFHSGDIDFNSEKKYTFGNNVANHDGGAIYAVADMNISNAEFTGNTALDGKGGAIYNLGNLTVNNSTFTENTANDIDNDIYNNGVVTFEGVNTLEGGIDGTGSMVLDADSKVNTKSLTQSDVTIESGAVLKANSAAVSGGLTLNDATFDAMDNETVTYNIGSLNGTGNINLDVDLTGETPLFDVLNITSGADNNAALIIDNISFDGTVSEFEKEVITGNTDNITLDLSDSLKNKYSGSEVTDITYEADDYIADIDFDKNSFDTVTYQEKSKKTLLVDDNTTLKLAKVITEAKHEIDRKSQDALATINTTSGTRSMSATSAGSSNARTLTENLGTTAKGTITIEGRSAEDLGSLDMNGKTGFDVSNVNTTVNLTNLNITNTANSDGSLINITNNTSSANLQNVTVGENSANVISSNGTLNIEDSEINAGINNTKALNLSGTNTIAAITDAETPAGTTNINSGTSTIGSIAQKSIKITGGKLIFTDNIQATEGITNNAELEISGGTLATDVSGTGTTTFNGNSEITEGAMVSQDVTLASGELTNNGTVLEDTTISSGTLNNNGVLSDVTISSGKLISNADQVGTVDNSGTYEITGGTVTNAISGAGLVNISGDTTNSAINTLTGDVNVVNGATLTLASSGDAFSTANAINLTNSSTLNIQNGIDNTIANLTVANSDNANIMIDWGDKVITSDLNGLLSVSSVDLTGIGATNYTFATGINKDNIAIADSINLITSDGSANMVKYSSSDGKLTSLVAFVLPDAVDDNNTGESSAYSMSGNEQAGIGSAGTLKGGNLVVQGNGNSINNYGVVVGDAENNKTANLVLKDTNMEEITGDLITVNGGSTAKIEADTEDEISLTGSNGNVVTLIKDDTLGNATVEIDAGEDKVVNIEGNIMSDDVNNVINLTSGTINHSGNLDPGTVNVATTYNRLSGKDWGMIYNLNDGGTLTYSDDKILYDPAFHPVNGYNRINFNGGTLDTRNNMATSFVLADTGFPAIGLQLNANSNFYGDVDLAAGTMDNFVDSDANVEVNAGTLHVAGLNIISDSPTTNRSVPFAGANLRGSVDYTGSSQLLTAIYKYDVAYDPTSGNFDFTRYNTGAYTDYNPGVLAAPIAAQLGGYLTQLNSYNQAFSNMDMYMLMPRAERQAMKLRNKMAASDSNIVYDPTVTQYEQKGGWFRPYATFERVNLNNGPTVANNMYGSFFGGDSELFDLGHGWDGMYSIYVGYNGSHQTYDGVGIYQNGGTLGATFMAFKDNFFTGLTANVGGSGVQANTAYGTDNFGMLMTGVASKTGYNFELANGRFIIQPSMLLSYSFVNIFNYTNAANVSIESDPLHAIQLEPGIKFIYNAKNGWQPYAGVSMVWNIMDKTRFSANDVSLPEMSVQPFVRYGIGVRKAWGERFTGFAQAYLTNGGRTGIGLQAGFRWMIGKETPKKQPAISNQTPLKPKANIVLSSMK